MSTSGVTILELTRDELINAALRKIGVVGEGSVATTEQIETGAQALNTTFLELQTLGLPLWNRKELPIPMVAGKSTYNIGIGMEVGVPFPLKLYQARFLSNGSSSQIDMEIKANYDWSLLPINSSGTPVSVSYQPMINHGVLSVWPTPDGSSPGVLTITYQSPVDVTTMSGQTIDYPQEWQNTIIYYLAWLLSDEYGLPLADRQWFEKQAEKHTGLASSFGMEDASLFFYPDRRGM